MKNPMIFSERLLLHRWFFSFANLGQSGGVYVLNRDGSLKTFIREVDGLTLRQPILPTLIGPGEFGFLLALPHKSRTIV
ncbi:MAG: hypothetical protein CM1200mP39_26080 [Dehalococcoidia bacterium]|nr:MAG: hypothetical protein CM1200mP39_26080 [Dehalococcoidia bacterium]